MIVKIPFRHEDGERFEMLFGNSYKTWQSQLTEYLLKSHSCEFVDGKRLPKVFFDTEKMPESSLQKWPGGCKWCEVSNFQETLDHYFKNKKASDYRFTASLPVMREAQVIYLSVFL